MSTKDIKTKDFLKDNSRFTDLCNYVLFNGEQVIKPEMLVERDPKEAFYFLDNEKSFSDKKIRDLLKGVTVKQTDEVIFALIGIENQSDIHYAMPVKNLLYDALNYASQVKAIGRQHRVNKDFNSGAEFLSGLNKDDRLIPVITITVYWGVKDWDGPRSLHEMLDIKQELKFFVDNYNLHLIVPNEIKDFSKFHTSLKQVLEVLGSANSREKMTEKILGDLAFKTLENDAVDMINTFAGISINPDRKKGVTDMCKAWLEQKQLGRDEGQAEERIKAIQNMLEFGVAKELILQKYSEEEYGEAEATMTVLS